MTRHSVEPVYGCLYTVAETVPLSRKMALREAEKLY